MPNGDNPVGSLAGVWSGQALRLSLAQASVDQQILPLSVLPATVQAGDERAASTPADLAAVVGTVSPDCVPVAAAEDRACLAIPATDPLATTSSTPSHPAQPTHVASSQSSGSRLTGVPGARDSSKSTMLVAKKGKALAGSQAAGSPDHARAHSPHASALAAEGSPARAEGKFHAVESQSISPGPVVDPKSAAACDSTAEPDTAAQKRMMPAAAAVSRVPGSHGHNQDEHQARHLEIKMVPAGPELVDVEYPLYHNYQVVNHHDDLSKVNCLRALYVTMCMFYIHPRALYTAAVQLV